MKQSKLHPENWVSQDSLQNIVEAKDLLFCLYTPAYSYSSPFFALHKADTDFTQIRSTIS